MYARISAVLVALALAVTGLAAAQETTGSIGGTVVDAQGLPVPGASVMVTGPQGARTIVTDGEGHYGAPFLTPGTYTVRVELQGFKASEQKDIQVSLSQRREINVKLEAGGLTETVQVTGAAPVIDTRSTTIGGVLDPETLRRLPVNRSLAGILYLVPGVSDSNGAGAATPSIAGGSGLENNYIIDGVNITDVGFGGMGSYNSQYGSLGAGVTSDFIKETEVKTGGYEAEFGQATGGVVNVVTKSGSNNFAGSIFGYARPQALEASWKTLTTLNGTVNTEGSSSYDTGVSLGGRIVPNRLFFFGTYNPQWQKRTFLAPNNAAPVFPFAALGGVDRDRRIQAYAGKVTAQLNSSNRLDVSIFGDPSKGVSGLQRTSALRRIVYPGVPGTTDISGGFSELDYGAHNQSVRYDGIFGARWLVEGAVSHSDQKFHETPTVNAYNFVDVRVHALSACGLQNGVPSGVTVPTGAPVVCPQGTTGGLGFFENNDGSNAQYQVKSTNIFNAGGTHEIRYGLSVEDVKFLRGTNYSGGPALTANAGKSTVTGVPVQIRCTVSAAGACDAGGTGTTFYRATRGLFVPSGDNTQRYTSFFIQDTYQAGRLTVRPGVRLERQFIQGTEPGGLQPTLCHEDDTKPGLGDGSGSPKACEFTWNNVAPRIGATFDLTGTGKAKLFANWGRFYAKIPTDLAARAMSADTGITRQNYCDTALTVIASTAGCGTTSSLQLTSLAAAEIDPDAGSTYTDEFLTGVEFEVFGNANLSVRYTHRTLPQILEDIGQLPIAGYFLGAEDENASVEYFITNPGTDTKVVQCCGSNSISFENPIHKYDAVEVTLNKRFGGHWSALSSYRWSKLSGNFEGFFRSDNGQSDPAISSLFDFPTNDPTYVATGPTGTQAHGGNGDIRFQGCTLGCGVLPVSRPHQLKLYGSSVWGPVNIGIGFNAGSGQSLTGLGANPVYANAGEIPLTERGGGFQTVDGLKTRAAMDLSFDLHGDYGVNIAGKRFLLLADVFNLFNRQATLNYDNFYETTVGTLNPNYGQPVNGGSVTTPAYQAPTAVRVGARFDW
jgi:hypothetical protein